MNYQGIEISAQVIGVGKQETTDGFKGKWEILYPNYIITCNGEEFEYGDSPHELGEITGIKQCLFLHKDVLYQDCQDKKRRLLNYDNKIILPSFKNLKDVNEFILGSTKSELVGDGLLFAFRCIIQDALVKYENADIGEFADNYGYTDIKSTITIYNNCLDVASKLKLPESKLYELLGKLSEDGIE